MKHSTLLLLALVSLPATAAAAQQTVWATTPAPPTPSVAPTPAVAGVAQSPRPARAPRPAVAATVEGMAYAPSVDALRGPDFSARYPQDPADSLYREARTLLNRGEWRRSATLFGQVAARQPASAYAADALYWQAFALYRIGGIAELREALAALDARKSRFPRAENTAEAEALTTRVSGALAARGDASASNRVRSQASAGAGSCDSEELSVRASALSTLMRNDPKAATPILSKVLDRRDECSVSLRSNAVMILGRQDEPAARAKLMEVAKNDPAPSVRADAIGYVAQANTDEMASTLEAIVRNDPETSVQRSAVRALGSMTAPRARTAIKSLIERSNAPERLRLDAIGTFDRRAGVASGFGFNFACSDGSCVDREMVAARAGVSGFTTAPPAPPARPAPAAKPAPAPSPVAERARSEAEREAAMEARAMAMADARDAAMASARAGQRPMALSVNGDFAFAGGDDDRRISPEDAAWLRGVYPKLETNRLKSAAAAVLARSGDEATTTWLSQMVQREEEPAEVRASILSRLGRDLPIAQLGRLYDGASSRTIRMEIVSVLGRREEPEATDKLIDIVRNGTDPQLRRSAITALNNKKDPRTTQLLLELIDR